MRYNLQTDRALKTKSPSLHNHIMYIIIPLNVVFISTWALFMVWEKVLSSSTSLFIDNAFCAFIVKVLVRYNLNVRAKTVTQRNSCVFMLNALQVHIVHKSGWIYPQFVSEELRH